MTAHRPELRGDLEAALLGEARQVIGASARLTFLYVNGWRRDLSVVTALAFEPGAAEPSLVVKIGLGEGAEPVAAEGKNLAVLARATEDRFRASVPGLLRMVEHEGATLVVETVVPGAPLLDVAPRGASRLLETAADWLVLFHQQCDMRDEPLAREGYDRLFVRPVTRYLASFRPGERERQFLERSLRAAEALIGERLPLVYHHADFCPANLRLADGRLGVIDWEAPFAHALPGADLIHLIASIAFDAWGGDDLGPFERAFLAPDGFASAGRAALLRYARALALPPPALRLLLTVYWLEYALEKAEEMVLAERRQARPAELERPLEVLTLARFGEGTCLNLKLLAENEKRLALP